MFTEPEVEVNVVLAQVVLAEPTNVTPAGNVSLSDAPVMGELFGLVKVMVRVD